MSKLETASVVAAAEETDSGVIATLHQLALLERARLQVSRCSPSVTSLASY